MFLIGFTLSKRILRPSPFFGPIIFNNMDAIEITGHLLGGCAIATFFWISAISAEAITSAFKAASSLREDA